MPLERRLFSCEWLRHHIRHEYISVRIAITIRGVFNVKLLAFLREFMLADMAPLGFLQVSGRGWEVGSKPRLWSPDCIGALCEYDAGRG